MLERFKKEWRSLRDGKPGERFQARYRRHRASRPLKIVRVLMFLGGLVLFVAGLFFMVVPGPGIPIAAIGAALVANESLLTARALDRLEVRARKIWHDFRA